MNILSAIKTRLVIIVPYIWLLFFFLLPFLLVLKIALSDLEYGQPPYTPQLSLSDGWSGFWDKVSMFDLENFTFLIGDSLYIKSYLSSLQIAFVSTLFTLLIGFPLAYGMARAPDRLRPMLLMLVILPFWTSFLIRVYAWIGILKQEGLLNQFLLWLGVIDTPLEILSTNTAVYIGIVYSYLPFMVLPIYSALEKMDESLVEAARDLGCTRIGAFWKVTARLAVPGILAGCLLVFIPAMGEFVIPDLLGGSGTLMIGKTLWIEFFNNSDWTVASAIAIILLIVLVVPIVLFQNAQAKAAEAGK
ncbi:ABC-type spermidine/putrescine transport system, permease component I [Hoeflea phototrophica DFL-43]|uniref:ABC-type spermidine/putrescine transport system, permease component I n=1 Tax=Hoeflea phototrophica (strain DSM 17068 / NCIMB 14078 / DFL-43) TaxID=411684 RepID=A9CYZ1_HOEPD|nr:ABC transporter permease subunit [Hoeflea phototrophica]EDQ34671.1 ABC-type spermidine/putrescine transport system, permease component I [Hoeflea phototrophica DFL-43]